MLIVQTSDAPKVNCSNIDHLNQYDDKVLKASKVTEMPHNYES